MANLNANEGGCCAACGDHSGAPFGRVVAYFPPPGAPPPGRGSSGMEYHSPEGMSGGTANTGCSGGTCDGDGGGWNARNDLRDLEVPPPRGRGSPAPHGDGGGTDSGGGGVSETVIVIGHKNTIWNTPHVFSDQYIEDQATAHGLLDDLENFFLPPFEGFGGGGGGGSDTPDAPMTNKACKAACDAGGEAANDMCRKLTDPSAKAACWAAVIVGGGLCYGFCNAYFPPFQAGGGKFGGGGATGSW